MYSDVRCPSTCLCWLIAGKYNQGDDEMHVVKSRWHRTGKIPPQTWCACSAAAAQKASACPSENARAPSRARECAALSPAGMLMPIEKRPGLAHQGRLEPSRIHGNQPLQRSPPEIISLPTRTDRPPGERGAQGRCRGTSTQSQTQEKTRRGGLWHGWSTWLEGHAQLDHARVAPSCCAEGSLRLPPDAHAVVSLPELQLQRVAATWPG